MEIKNTVFEGLVEIIPAIYRDERGNFLETFRSDILEDYGLPSKFVQDNQSFSVKNVVRGLHIQLPPHEQIKLVRASNGKVMDIVVDVRKDSDTFGKHYKCLLDSNLGNMLFIPAGFLHGIAVLEDTVFSYKCSSYYDRNSESGVRYNDRSLQIDWGIHSPILTEKDQILPSFKEFLKKYVLA